MSSTSMKTALGSLVALLGAFTIASSSGCHDDRSAVPAKEPSVRYVQPSAAVPRGTAPNAKHRLLASRPDGAKDHVLILRDGDEVATALAKFATDEHVVAAHFTAIGAVRDPEVAWFDLGRREYQAMRRSEQMEVLALIGDIGAAESGEPVVHAHITLGRRDGTTFGGHLLGATASPTVEVFLTTYPTALDKREDPETSLKLFELPQLPARSD